MKSTLTLLLLFALALNSFPDEHKSLREAQWKYPRVRAAAREKDLIMKKRLADKGLSYPPHAILFRAFKKEASLELWATDTDTQPYVLIRDYSICTSSGVLGPKRRFGDVQVPEGFYELDWFNPQSNFFLSMHISYPNAADRILGYRPHLGGDIFLHGDCASIGCIPITDDFIKEVYWLSVLVQDKGQKHLPIQIFPARLTDSGFKSLEQSHPHQEKLITFWRNLKEGYDLFENTHRLPHISTRPNGSYAFSLR